MTDSVQRGAAPADGDEPLLLSQALAAEYQTLFGDAIALDLPTAKAEYEEARLRELFKRVHALPEGPTALCLSGGGIRSATFSLGVLQGLARVGQLEHFDYLSTVSGGGYIGSWLTASSSRLGGVEQVCKLMRNREVGTTTSAESAQVDFLRDYSNYLTPQLGLFSADTWAAVASVLRNLLLNWLLLLPVLALALMWPQLGMLLALLLTPGPLAIGALVVLAAAALAVSVSYVELDLPSAGDARGEQRKFLWRYLLPLMFASCALMLAWAFTGSAPGATPKLAWWWFLLFGTITHLGGFACGRARRWKTWRWSAEEFGADLVIVLGVGALAGWSIWLLSKSAPLASFQSTAMDLAPELARLHEQARRDTVRMFVWLAVPAMLVVWFISTALYAGAASKLTSDEDLEWFARATGWVLLAAFFWLLLGGVALILPEFLANRAAGWVKWAGSAAGGGSALTTLFAARQQRPSSRSARETASGAPGSNLDAVVSKLAAPLAIAFLLALVQLGSVQLQLALPKLCELWPSAPELGRLLVFGFGMLLLLVAANLSIDVNRFSLHGFYRNRLVRAYLGSSHETRETTVNRFTGFDPGDDLRMHTLKQVRPLHIVNVALNLVKGKRLAWQHRKAESFTISALHCGSAACASYRVSEHYGKGISLGTAVAISGAAASPNMGYHSSPLAAFLMTLFNVRLGWWLGNPSKAGANTWYKAGPRFAARPIVAEALGLTDDQNPYVYLSDGGHFENLGLYEMVLRRCRKIIVVDAGCDPDYEFEDFGNAVRKISIDLGIPVVLDQPISLELEQRRRVRCYRATLRYGERDSGASAGTLLYLKPALCGDEPVDVRNYAAAHAIFPHESTGDQWFDEPQFESYRHLGEHTVHTLWERAKAD